MIDIKELRIGNYVSAYNAVSDKDEIAEIMYIKSNTDIGIKYKRKKGIVSVVGRKISPITLDFSSLKRIEEKNRTIRFLYSEDKKDVYLECYDNIHSFVFEYYSLHIFQNWYFFESGSELKF